MVIIDKQVGVSEITTSSACDSQANKAEQLWLGHTSEITGGLPVWTFYQDRTATFSPGFG